ncbi:helix-turn-helix domain-containing protein [Paraconexibacter antarcticus]|uniref:Helix-turn-helix domain-containing protein n=1 Tax=Paraconexibacter antarcticus TaxID=2949664 RepID=A0ABY5DNJ6_9ACTN|nr:helix-turn-helix transcriptional regulator [Paraconexibacter antarcticus]UTI62632.1 helix-turn-helix domain-containing protein [Paraconexibacter antarcticus]
MTGGKSFGSTPAPRTYLDQPARTGQGPQLHVLEVAVLSPPASPHPLAAARKDRGLTQFELAIRAQVQPATISRIERGCHLPRVDTGLRIAAAVETPVRDLWPIIADRKATA